MTAPRRDPRLSVVVPFRDAGATIDDALASLAAQTFDAFECVLVDHASTDSAGARARAMAARDPRFRVVRAEGSFAAALNAGVAAAQTPVIARMDADDLAHPERLARQWDALARDPGLTIVSCLVDCFPAASVGAGMRRYVAWLNRLRTPEEIRDALFVESPLAHPSVLLRRPAFDAAGGYREFDGPEDYDLWLRLLLAGRRAAKVPEVLLHWRDSPRRLSRVDPRCHQQRFIATKLLHFPTAVAPTRALQICGAGPTGRRWARHLRARGYRLTRFLDVDARRWGRTIHGAPVCEPRSPDPGDGFLLIAAGQPGTREQIERWLSGGGLRPWEQFLAVA